MKRLLYSRHDGLLVLMTVIWGANYSIVKVALEQIPPLPFNSLRLGLASLLFLLTIALCPSTRARDRGSLRAGPSTRRAGGSVASMPPVFTRSRISIRDWVLIGVFGVIGHCLYQLCFIFGIDRTTASNSALILGCSPVVVALFSAAFGHERVRAMHWAGALLSVAGIYLVVGTGAHVSRSTLVGDLLTIVALFGWGVYTVGAKGLLERHSPLEVTGYSMAIGTVPFVLLSLGDLRSLDWQRVHGDAWAALVFSAVFALLVAYLIWYAAVQRIGNVRTAMYSNLTPISALALAVIWLGERLTAAEVAGAAAILTGMALTRLAAPSHDRTSVPAEE